MCTNTIFFKDEFPVYSLNVSLLGDDIPRGEKKDD